MARKHICGIYMLTSPTGKMYVGQSVNIEHRLLRYRTLDCDRQPRLFNSILKHGFEAHTVEILNLCPKHELDVEEVRYILIYNTFLGEHGLNCNSGGKSGHKRSKESGDKLRRPRSPEVKAKIKATKALNPYIVSEETRAKMRANNLGKKHTEESKKKMAIASKGRRHSPETLVRMSEIQKARPHKSGYTQKPSLTRSASLLKSHKNNPRLHSVAKTIYTKDADGIILKFRSVTDCQKVIGVCSKSVHTGRITGKAIKGHYFSFTPFD